MLKIQLDKILAILGSIVFFFNIPPFFLWHINFAIYWCFLLIFLFSSMFKFKAIDTSQLVIIILFILLHALNSVSLQGVSMPSIVTLITICAIIVLPIKTKKDIFKSIVLTFTVINLVSIPFYILAVLGSNLPSVIIEPLNPVKTGFYLNYLFTLSYSDHIVNGFFRYQSIFDEPGVVGSLSMLIIVMTDGKNGYRVSRFVALLSGVLSFSFAFYILLFVYIGYNGLFKHKSRVKLLFIIPILISVSVPFYSVISEEVPMVKTMENRFSLLMNGPEKASNRTSSTFDKAFYDFLNSNDIYLGAGKHAASKLDPAGNSFKYYIYDYGVISFILINFIILFYCFLSNSNKVTGALVVIIVSLFLLQRSNYISLWFVMLFVCFASSPNVSLNEIKRDIPNKS
jgi:hypothetical protein